MYFMQKPRFLKNTFCFRFLYTDINKREKPTLIVLICCESLSYLFDKKTSLYFRYSRLMKNG